MDAKGKKEVLLRDLSRGTEINSKFLKFEGKRPHMWLVRSCTRTYRCVRQRSSERIARHRAKGRPHSQFSKGRFHAHTHTHTHTRNVMKRHDIATTT
jgi:hypothetical protein